MDPPLASNKTNNKKLLIFVRKILQRIFGPKRNEKADTDNINANNELMAFLGEINIGAQSKARLKGARYVCRGPIYTERDEVKT
jgi:hypothetical protein